MMNYRSCAAQLPSGAKVCPDCRTPTLAYRSNSGSPSSDPGAIPYPYSLPAGSYSAYSPSLISAGPQGQQPPPGFPAGLTVLLIVLSVLLIGGGAPLSRNEENIASRASLYSL